MKSTRKLSKEHLDRKSQPWRKVNGQSQCQVKFNGQPRSQRSMVMTWSLLSADVSKLTQAVMTSLGLTWRIWWRQRTEFWRVEVRVGTWRIVEACDGAWRHVKSICGTWRRVPVTPRIIVARGGTWKVRWRRYFIERQIGEITFWWCNLWYDWRSGSGGGGKAVVFDVLKSRWRQWCCSQQRLQMTPKKTRLLKSGAPND